MFTSREARSKFYFSPAYCPGTQPSAVDLVEQGRYPLVSHFVARSGRSVLRKLTAEQQICLDSGSSCAWLLYPQPIRSLVEYTPISQFVVTWKRRLACISLRCTDYVLQGSVVSQQAIASTFNAISSLVSFTDLEMLWKVRLASMLAPIAW